MAASFLCVLSIAFLYLSGCVCLTATLVGDLMKLLVIRLTLTQMEMSGLFLAATEGTLCSGLRMPSAF